MASIRSNEASMWKLEIKERLIDGNNGLKLQDACDKRAAGQQGGRAAGRQRMLNSNPASYHPVPLPARPQSVGSFARVRTSRLRSPESPPTVSRDLNSHWLSLSLFLSLSCVSGAVNTQNWIIFCGLRHVDRLALARPLPAGPLHGYDVHLSASFRHFLLLLLLLLLLFFWRGGRDVLTRWNPWNPWNLRGSPRISGDPGMGSD